MNILNIVPKQSQVIRGWSYPGFLKFNLGGLCCPNQCILKWGLQPTEKLKDTNADQIYKDQTYVVFGTHSLYMVFAWHQSVSGADSHENWLFHLLKCVMVNSNKRPALNFLWLLYGESCIYVLPPKSCSTTSAIMPKESKGSTACGIFITVNKLKRREKALKTTILPP